ncbi:hypothetical protein [Legionella londiniensis]|nr:hypothetical protein [Legionella londiniensis]
MKRWIIAFLLSLSVTGITGCGFDLNCETCGGTSYVFNYSATSCCPATPW